MSEAEEIARFIAERGVTHCPTVYLTATQAAAAGQPQAPLPASSYLPSKEHFRRVDRHRWQRRLDKRKKSLS